VYISGESGSGKELAARLIHQQSAPRAHAAVHSGQLRGDSREPDGKRVLRLPQGRIHRRRQRPRRLLPGVANGGTLFLDEVADLPLLMQVKLLRAIQEKKVRKVGSAVEEAVDVRIVSATHRKLKDCVDAGSFRQDLYYRLNVIELKMPPLRERQEDVEPLVEALLVRICGTQPPRVEPAAMRALKAYSFPGNVRELENILERATALCSNDTVLIDDLQLAPAMAVSDSAGREGETLDDYINRVEKQAIVEALTKTDFNRTAAARLLGVTFRSLRYRIERLGIEE
jgi:two-component system response regulator PilR (NtrC family)